MNAEQDVQDAVRETLYDYGIWCGECSLVEYEDCCALTKDTRAIFGGEDTVSS